MLSQSEVNELRRDFPALQQRHPRNGRPPVYFDNSCVTLTPRPVAQAVWDYSTKYPGCGGHRSGHWFSALTQEKVEESRNSLAAFLGVPTIRKSGGEDIAPLIFTRNTSEGTNLIVKNIKRLGFGFRNFENYRLRLLLRCGAPWQHHQVASIRPRHPRVSA